MSTDLHNVNSLVSIRNYIALKHKNIVCIVLSCLVSIRNYIALKLRRTDLYRHICLVSIRNYIALKLIVYYVIVHVMFSIHTELHRSKTA